MTLNLADYQKSAADTVESLSAENRIQWALERLPANAAITSSFGIQSAVLLHMATRIRPDLPVIFVDTGYLFPETYAFANQLTEQLGLNLHVFSPEWTPARLEATFGKLWEQGVDGIEQYNQLMKVDPMETALRELDVRTWFAGLRREQSSSRANRAAVEQRKDGLFKVYPLIDWSNRDIHQYLVKHELPYHPLWDEGYVSVGDWHTSRPLTADMTEEETRFFGLKRECGLHL